MNTETYTTTRQPFTSVSGISVDASVIVTVHKLSRPEVFTATGSVYSTPFAFTRNTFSELIKACQSSLLDRHIDMYDQIQEALSDVMAKHHAA